jgi:hypothetical protein
MAPRQFRGNFRALVAFPARIKSLAPPLEKAGLFVKIIARAPVLFHRGSTCRNWGVKARVMPKKPKKPNDNSREGTLGPLARVLGEIDADMTSADKPTEKSEPAEPAEPGSGGDSGSAPQGEAEKGETLPEGETPEGL